MFISDVTEILLAFIKLVSLYLWSVTVIIIEVLISSVPVDVIDVPLALNPNPLVTLLTPPVVDTHCTPPVVVFCTTWPAGHDPAVALQFIPAVTDMLFASYFVVINVEFASIFVDSLYLWSLVSNFPAKSPV